MLTDLFDPVFRLVLDVCSAALLGITFVFQSLTVLVALDVVFATLYQSVSAQLASTFSKLLTFLPHERERRAAMMGLIKFYSNVMWVRLVYPVHNDCWTYMAGGPLFWIGVMQTIVSFFAERLTSDERMVTQALYMIFLFSLFLMVFNTITGAPDYILMETVFLLRSPIDAICSSVDTLFKLSDSALAVDQSMSVYTTQIARYSFWTSVHLLQLGIAIRAPVSATTSLAARRVDLVLYFSLFMHDLLELFVPLRQLLTQVMHERFVAKTFPRLTTAELSAVASETCSVCLSDHSQDTVRLQCGHLLHSQCLQRIMQQSVDSQTPQASRCPMCRASIEMPPGYRRRASRSLFGQGTRGTRAPVVIPFFGSLTNPTGHGTGQPLGVVRQHTLDGTGRLGRAEQLIAEHLSAQDLQHGDVIHIRIIPRRARAGLSAAQAVNIASDGAVPLPAGAAELSAAAGPLSPGPPSGSSPDTETDSHRASATTQSPQQPLSPIRTYTPLHSVPYTQRSVRNASAPPVQVPLADELLSGLSAIHAGQGLYSAAPSSAQLNIQVDSRQEQVAHSSDAATPAGTGSASAGPSRKRSIEAVADSSTTAEEGAGSSLLQESSEGAAVDCTMEVEAAAADDEGAAQVQESTVQSETTVGALESQKNTNNEINSNNSSNNQQQPEQCAGQRSEDHGAVHSSTHSSSMMTAGITDEEISALLLGISDSDLEVVLPTTAASSAETAWAGKGSVVERMQQPSPAAPLREDEGEDLPDMPITGLKRPRAEVSQQQGGAESTTDVMVRSLNSGAGKEGLCEEGELADARSKRAHLLSELQETVAAAGTGTQCSSDAGTALSDEDE